VSRLATVVFAAAEGRHLLAEPRSNRFSAFRRAFDEPAFLAELARRGFRWIPRGAPAFPARLAELHDPPPGLFVRGRGELELLSGPAVAIVGPRGCSEYGAHVASSLARELAAAGVVVISGMARGIDGAAHRGALATGITAAVLGCGIDRDYPRAHAGLAAEIAERGLILSEYPPGVEPAPWRFPARNRIVAGLAQATVVVEARGRSGALITADLALEAGREVLAVPGEITSALSAGTNGLLRLGATPVTSAADVLELLGVERAGVRPDGPGSLEQDVAAVLAATHDAAGSVDELVERTGLRAPVVAAALARLEVLGLVFQAGGVYRGEMPATS